jgi:trehalose utilization protein
MQVTVWSEDLRLSDDPYVRSLQDNYAEAMYANYPDGVNEVVADGLRRCLGDRATVRTARLDEPMHGLGKDELDSTDVLVWWSHIRNDLLSDEVAERIYQRVLEGMGFIALHSTIESKPFLRLMGTTCTIARWRQGDDWEALWTVNPGHRIARGVPPVFVIPNEEVYAEYFDIPQPDELVFISSFEGGEVCRSGCCFFRGNGRIFYFRPGHEAHPTYHQPEVQQVIANAVEWAYIPAPSLPLQEYYTADVAAKEGPLGWFVPAGTRSG